MKKIQSILMSLTLLVSFYACTDTVNQSAALTQTSITKVYPTNLVTNQRIYIVGQNFDSITSVVLPGGDTVTNFERQGFNQISLKAPAGMTDGYIILKAGTKEYKSPNQVKMVVPTFTQSFPDSVKTTEILTILGTNLLETQQVILGDTTIVDALHFTRKSDTEIQVTIPTRTVAGMVSVKVVSLSGSVIDLPKVFIIKPPVGPAPLALVYYEDAVASPFNEWGWGRTADYASTDFVRTGKASMKVTYSDGGNNGIAFQSGNVATAPYTEVGLSVYGTAGTDGKVVLVKLNWSDPGVNVIVKEGQWTDYSVPLSSLNQASAITVLQLTASGWTGTVYFDHIGLR